MHCRTFRCLSSTTCFLALFLAGTDIANASDPSATLKPRTGPPSVAQSLERLRLDTQLKIELAACEPQVIDPVAIRFDEHGQMWVVEMRDYPHGPMKGASPRSRIVVLQDRDQDGRYETSTVFADKLPFITGLQPWQGGVFVTLAGRIAYMKDRDGDGRADIDETWYRGFAEENPQLRANHPRLALDNHIYVANGLRGGAIVDASIQDTSAISISGRDFRFDPITRHAQAVTGVGQFGMTFDDAGNRFVCSNRNPLKQILFEERYLSQNPRVAVAKTSQDVATAGADSRLYPISRAWTTSHLHANQFTAACGVTIFRGDGLPTEYYGNGFTCDPTGNLVHREILTPSGPTFSGKPGRDGVEFLASTDEWFRPVNLTTGPDGALYIVDMCRAVIEHPQFMPTELQSRPDLLWGTELGRIYRVSSRQQERSPNRIVWPGTMDEPQLVATLEHPNAWWRETAARLLLERQAAGTTTQLRTLSRKSELAVARLRAFHLLEGLGKLEKGDLIVAFRDADPILRRRALVLAEPYLKDEEVRQAARELANDRDSTVRFQAALSLAPAQNAADERALMAILKRDWKNEWTRVAVLLSAGTRARSLAKWQFAQQRERQGDERIPSEQILKDLFRQSLAAEYTAGDEDLFRQVVADGLSPMSQRLSGLYAFSEALRAYQRSLDPLTKRLDVVPRALASDLLREVAEVAADTDADDSDRVRAIRILANTLEGRPVILKLATSEPARDVRTAAVDELARFASTGEWESLLRHYSQESPVIRTALINGTLRSPARIEVLLQALESDRIKASELDRVTSNRLLKLGDKKLRTRAAKLLHSAVPADRQQVLQEYQAALKLTGSASRGRAVFSRVCGNCHHIAGVGHAVGPDISDSRTKTPPQLLTDILQPNRAIDANYTGYQVLTEDGRVFTGIIESESSSSISLKLPEAKTITLLRNEISELKSSGVSLMPIGLEKDVDHQAMADLIAYIKGWRYLSTATTSDE